MFSTFDKIKELAKKQGISLNTLEKKLNFSTNYIYSIKRGNPKVENLQQIADYFHVSTDYLLGRTDNPNISTSKKSSEQITPFEQKNLVMFRAQTKNMTDEQKAKFNSALEGLMQTARALIEDDSNWK